MKGEAFNLIGPNAILQLWPVLNVQLGAERARALLDQAGLHTLPDGHAMIPEADAASLHRAVRCSAPGEASIILRAARSAAVQDRCRGRRVSMNRGRLDRTRTAGSGSTVGSISRGRGRLGCLRAVAWGGGARRMVGREGRGRPHRTG